MLQALRDYLRWDRDWHVWVPVARVRLMDGTQSSGPVMRRRHAGAWQCRAMTDDEMRDYQERSAW